MATNNGLNIGLSGASGTGTFTGNSNPTYETPTLGAALATSINFGGSTLSNYVQDTSWTPVFSYVTPGTSSIAYNTQAGQYMRVGNLVHLTWTLLLTPTHGTASGNAQITGLPFTAAQNAYGVAGFYDGQFGLLASATSNTSVCFYLAAGTSTILTLQIKQGTNNAYLTPANQTGGVQFGMSGTLSYLI